MLKRRLFRAVPLCLAFTLLVVGGACLPPTAATALQGDGLVVHEWGTFTSVAGRNGEALSWRPLSFESDLPGFVYSIDKGATWESSGLRYPSKSSRFVTVRMETPLLYFYAKGETDVTVKVGFNGGTITEWYPQARAAGKTVEWAQLRVLPGARDVDLPHEGGPNHYYPARDTDAATLRVRGERGAEHEKFLFYRGVGDSRLPLAVLVESSKVVVRSTQPRGVGKVILFERRGGAAGHSVGDAPAGETRLARPALAPAAAPPRAELKALLVAHGLYEREAEAMLDTWRDSWFEEGLRVFYVLPREAVDAILPLTIEPQPKELVRVLVGRAELITPEMERDVTAQLSKFEDPAPGARAAALREIDKYGRFADTILGQLMRYAPDRQTQARVQRVLQATAPRPRQAIE